MATENPNPEIPTPMPIIPQNSRKSRPRVREVSSRFMSPAVVRSPAVVVDKQAPSTPFESHGLKNHSLRRSNTDFRPVSSRYGDENRPDHGNRGVVSPVRVSVKPRASVKLFRDGSSMDTPVPAPVPATVTGRCPVGGSRLVRHRSCDTDALKLLQAGGVTSEDGDGDGDCESVKSEPIESNVSDNCVRVSTPCSRSMELSISGHEQLQTVGGGGGGGLHCGKGGCGNMSKVARSLNLPPMPPGQPGCSRPQGMVEGKKVVVVARKGGGSSQLDDVLRLKLLHNHYLQWRFVNAKAQACLNAQKKNCERQLYSMAVKISELQESVKSKRAEVRRLKEENALSTILETQMPCLDEWSGIEEAYSTSLLELTEGLQNISSRLPFMGNVKADVKELNEALNSALKVTESIWSQVQGFVPKAEESDFLLSDLARVHSGEITLVQECGDLLFKTQRSQIDECSLRAQLIQFQKCKLEH